MECDIRVVARFLLAHDDVSGKKTINDKLMNGYELDIRCK